MQNLPKITGMGSIQIPKELPKDLLPKLLEGLIPVAFMSGEGSVMTRLCDFGLGVVMPFHAHVAMNAIVSDYVPYAYRTPCRYGLLGATGITALGLLKLNVFGPGFTDSVRSLWKYEKKPPPLPKGKTTKESDAK